MARRLGRGSSANGSRWRRVVVVAAATATFTPAAARAQAPGRPYGPSAPPLVSHHDSASDAIAIARARQAKGDCVGALEAFDAALRTSVDVSVYRDRGLCHEQLGQPFPAMDDFRVYLTALPEAPDAEDIRNRLNALDVANGMGGTGTGGETPASGDASGSHAGDHEDPFAVDTKGKAGAAAVAGSGDSARSGNYDQELVQNEKWDEAESSPMRRGTGMSFGAYGRGFGGTSNGVSGYGVGATLRGSLGRVSTLYGEIGYISYHAGSDADTGEREGGLSVGLGYEARIRLDEFASNAIILAGTLSYERVKDSNTRATANELDPRGKLGFRHVFGPGFGVELAAEVAQPIDLSSGTAPVTFIGGTLALLVGF